MFLPHALVVGESFLLLKKDESDSSKKNWNMIRDSRRPLQKQRELIRNARLTLIPAVGCGFPEIAKFQSYYEHLGIAIVIYDVETFGSGEPHFFDGRSRMRAASCTYIINLLFDATARHFDTILNLTGATKSKFFCTYCNKRHNYVNDHKCKTVCPGCFGSPACVCVCVWERERERESTVTRIIQQMVCTKQKIRAFVVL